MEEAENKQIVSNCQVACLGKNSLVREIFVLRPEELEKKPPFGGFNRRALQTEGIANAKP